MTWTAPERRATGHRPGAHASWVPSRARGPAPVDPARCRAGPEILPPEERKAAMSDPGPARGQVVPRRLHPGDRRRYRHPRLHHRREQGHQGREEHHRRRTRRQAARRRHPAPLRHRVPGPLEAQAHAGGVRPLPGRLRLHPLHRARSVSRSSSSAAGSCCGPGASTSTGPPTPRRSPGRPRRGPGDENARTAASDRRRRRPRSPAARKPPTASKRYTPKAPPRKKIPKPTE